MTSTELQTQVKALKRKCKVGSFRQHAFELALRHIRTDATIEQCRDWVEHCKLTAIRRQAQGLESVAQVYIKAYNEILDLIGE